MFHPRWRLTGVALAVLLGLFFWAPASSAEPPSPPPPQENGEPSEIVIELIQTALKSLGHYAGSPDGRIGPQTHNAIRDWQQSAGLEVSGELTRGQQQALIRESAAAGLTAARELLATLAPSAQSEPSIPPAALESAAPPEEPEPPPPSDSERINTLETTLEGFDQRLKTASDGVEANGQAVADLGSRLDSEIKKVDTIALRLDSLGAQMKQSNEVLEGQKSRLEDNSVKLYETLIRIDSAKKDLTLMRRAFERGRLAPAETNAPDSTGDTGRDPFGPLLPLVLCLLLPLAVVIDQGQRRSAATDGTSRVEHAAWVLVAWFGGGAGFFLIGIGIMYGPSLGGVIGNPGHFVSTMMLSELVDFPPGLLERLLPDLILASIVAVVACSSAPQGLTNRGHFMVALVAGGLVYPLFGHWIATPTAISEQSGWLAGPAFACPAATTNVALLGGILALSLANGLGLVRIHSIASSARPEPASMGTTGAMLLWVAWIGVILIATSDCLQPSVLLLSLSGAAGGAALGVLLVDAATTRTQQWQNRLPFAVLAGIVAAPVGAQELNFLELAALGALTGVSASLLMRFFATRSTADTRLASSLLVGGIFGTLAPAMFGPTGFLFVHSIDVLAPQLKGTGAALLLGLVAGRALAWPIDSMRFLSTRT